MKKIFTIVIVLLLTVTVNVYAEDYNILVDENNNFTLKDSSNNPVTDNSIAKYEDNTLTLGENTTFNEIKAKHDLTITSNNKEVSIKTLTSKEGNNYIASNINLNKLKVKDDDTYIFKIDIGGNLIVNNSVINIKETWNEIRGYAHFIDSTVTAIQSINMYGVDEEGYGYKIINSTVISGGQIYTQIGGAFIQNSKVEANSLYSHGYFYIEESDIYCYYFTQQGRESAKTYIKNSTVKVTKDSLGQVYIAFPSDGIYLDDSLTIENSEFVAGSMYISNGGLKMNNSKLYLLNEYGSLSPSSGKVDIKDSIVNVKGAIWISTRNKNINVIFENSEIEAGYIDTPSNPEPGDDTTIMLYAKDSKITTHGTSSMLKGNAKFENCELNIQKLLHFYNNLTIINSTGVLSGITMVDENLTIKDSILTFSNETGFNENFAPLSIKHDLKINNSNIVFDNKKNSNKAVYVQGNVILDDKIIPIDQEKTKLKLIKLEDDTDARTTCQNCYDADRPIYIYSYEDNTFSDYVKLATTKTINFRVKNGTWLDGTKEDIKLDYFYGEKIDVENLPEEVKKLLTSKMGEWSVDLNNIDPTKDQEIEFRYNIINPETATNFILLTIVVSLAIITIYKTRKKDFIKQ